MTYTAQVGDIFLCDSDRTGAKIVKFFMQAPTVWQWVWRFFRKTQQPVRFYHAGMVLDDKTMVEQQGKVQYGETQKILSRKIVIYRKKNLTAEQKAEVASRAIADIGKGYGIALVIGKLFTWLTGIKLFEQVIGRLTRQQEICVNRVVRWYNHIDTFGSPTMYDATTKTVDEYCAKSSDWEAVYVNGC